jgi:hypothetical protein
MYIYAGSPVSAPQSMRTSLNVSNVFSQQNSMVLNCIQEGAAIEVEENLTLVSQKTKKIPRNLRENQYN